MKVLLRTLTLSLLLVPALVASAEHTTPACSTPYRTIDAGHTAFYVVLSTDKTWIIQESNGHADLQRGGAPWWYVGTEPGWEMCWDVVTATGEQIEDPDLIVY